MKLNVISYLGQNILCSAATRKSMESTFLLAFGTLNTPPPRAKYSKKKPKPKYGTLELYNAKYINKGGKTLISAIVITNEKKNRSFWGKGVNV